MNTNINKRFIQACADGNLELAISLYNDGADIHVGTDDPFICACTYGRIEIAKWLVELGVDIRADSDWAFKLACIHGHIDVAKWLAQLGANIRVDNDYAFSWACLNNHIEIAKWLIQLDSSILAQVVHNSNIFIEYITNIIDVETTITLINNIINSSPIDCLPDPIEDVAIHFMFEYNRIDLLTRINLPYVSYDVVDGKIQNGIIKRLSQKSARKV